ncbi:hypothetical protein POY96_15530 [Bacteroides uniformis]|uniref:hypothetical protein n=1 Tax=Bacteroides uniformis TaxID=820 RepID=UPI00233003BE|nr:hypothetical protein [Bacteroides uniformis]MDC1839511.1 hypothetical protein [Bacteroides uniformis]
MILLQLLKFLLHPALSHVKSINNVLGTILGKGDNNKVTSTPIGIAIHTAFPAAFQD